MALRQIRVEAAGQPASLVVVDVVMVAADARRERVNVEV
jgi:hypothetical protein